MDFREDFATAELLGGGVRTDANTEMYFEYISSLRSLGIDMDINVDGLSMAPFKAKTGLIIEKSSLQKC